MIPIILEVTPRRAFASALDWPGWCRSGRTEKDAVEALAAAASRYAAVVDRAGLELPTEAAVGGFEVVDRQPGTTTTGFGVPDVVAESERAPLTKAQAERLAALVIASWKVLDEVVAKAPRELRKGPRGGGRDRDAAFVHVVNAEAAYSRSIGLRIKQPAPGAAAAIAEAREQIAAALASAHGTTAEGWRWPPGYAARRIAWHALDHAWEIEDRSEPF